MELEQDLRGSRGIVDRDGPVLDSGTRSLNLLSRSVRAGDA